MESAVFSGSACLSIATSFFQLFRCPQAFGLNLKGVEEKTTAKCLVKGQYREPDTQGPQVDKLLSAADGGREYGHWRIINANEKHLGSALGR